MPAANGRGNKAYVRANAKLKATAIPVCRWCYQVIDLTLKHPHPRSWSADHVTPMALGGALHSDRVPMHLQCNSIRGIQTLPPEPLDTTTEQW